MPLWLVPVFPPLLLLLLLALLLLPERSEGGEQARLFGLRSDVDVGAAVLEPPRGADEDDINSSSSTSGLEEIEDEDDDATVLLVIARMEMFAQSRHLQRPGAHLNPPAKQSQYFFTHFDFLQKQRGGGSRAGCCCCCEESKTEALEALEKNAEW